MIETKQDNDMTNRIDFVYAKTKIELSEPIWSDAVYEKNQTERCDQSDRYTENDIELSWPIGLGAEYEENQIGQLCDWSYWCGLCQKQNWVVMIDRIRSSLWKKSDKTMIGPIA